MLEKVISGGQKGVDQGGVRAAYAAGFKTGGVMPLHFKTEFGSDPTFASAYGLEESPYADYPSRTARNAKDSEATLWFGDSDTRGYWATKNACSRLYRYFIECDPDPERMAQQIVLAGWKTINVAGNRESHRPGIGKEAEEYFMQVFEFVHQKQGVDAAHEGDLLEDRASPAR